MKATPHYTTTSFVPEDEHTGALLTLKKYCRDAWRHLCIIEIFWTNRVRTAATDGVYIYINPQFYVGLPNDSQRAFVLGHEVLHVWLKHCQRGKFYRERGYFSSLIKFIHRIYNEAADYVINKILVAAGLEPIEGCMLDDRFGMNDLADEVYITLMEEQANQPPPDDDDSDETESGEGDESDDDTGDKSATDDDDSDDDSDANEGDYDDAEEDFNQPRPGDDSYEADPTDHDGHDDHLEPIYDGTPAEQSEAERADNDEIEKSIDKALDEAEQEGRKVSRSMSDAGSRQRTTGRISGTNWTEALATVLTQPGRNGRSYWGKIQRRAFMLTGQVRPTRKGTINRIGITEDISVSVDEVKRAAFDTNAAIMLDVVNPASGTLVMFCNTKVVSAVEVHSGQELLDAETPHGGGTYMSASLDYMEECGLECDIHLVFTDGELDLDDCQKLADNGSILVLDGQPGVYWMRNIEASGIEYIIMD